MAGTNPAAAELAASQLSGRWSVDPRHRCHDASCQLAYDLVPCGDGWCGIEVRDGKACGRIAPARGCWALLPAEVRTRFEAVAARMAEIMHAVGGVGLIHADLHLGNALFHRGGVRLIDFDDCGTGARLYELAVALWELRDRSDYSMFRQALVSGYRTWRDIDVTHLDDFIGLRQVAFGLWYTGIAQVNPAFAAKIDGVHHWSLSMLDLVEAG